MDVYCLKCVLITLNSDGQKQTDVHATTICYVMREEKRDGGKWNKYLK